MVLVDALELRGEANAETDSLAVVDTLAVIKACDEASLRVLLAETPRICTLETSVLMHAAIAPRKLSLTSSENSAAVIGRPRVIFMTGDLGDLGDASEGTEPATKFSSSLIESIFKFISRTWTSTPQPANASWSDSLVKRESL